MIFTVTPNPALDLNGFVDELIPNEKNYVRDEMKFPGGNGINAARIIRRLGTPVLATGFLGGGNGDEIEELLAKEGVDHSFVKISKMTRLSVTISELKTNLQTRLSFAGPRISREESKNLLRQIERIPRFSLVVIGGSIPPGISPSYIRQITFILGKKGIPFVIDAPGPVLRELLEAKPIFIKPNRHEFQEVVGRKIDSVNQVLKETAKWVPRIPVICVSSVEGGAVLVTQKSAWFGKSPRLSLKTTVGAGDSMVGAISDRLWKWMSSGRFRKEVEKGTSLMDRFVDLPPEAAQEMLRWGLAAASATLMTQGTKLGSRKKMEALLGRIRVSRIK